MKFLTPTIESHIGHEELQRLRFTLETSELVVAFIDHGLEINLMSKEFYRKGKWPTNTSDGWKIRAATKATEDLFEACPDVTMKIGDVEIDQNFFVQD